jgi:hypothetical protein
MSREAVASLSFLGKRKSSAIPFEGGFAEDLEVQRAMKLSVTPICPP